MKGSPWVTVVHLTTGISPPLPLSFKCESGVVRGRRSFPAGQSSWRRFALVTIGVQLTGSEGQVLGGEASPESPFCHISKTFPTTLSPQGRAAGPQLSVHQSSAVVGFRVPVQSRHSAIGWVQSPIAKRLSWTGGQPAPACRQAC